MSVGDPGGDSESSKLERSALTGNELVAAHAVIILIYFKNDHQRGEGGMAWHFAAVFYSGAGTRSDSRGRELPEPMRLRFIPESANI